MLQVGPAEPLIRLILIGFAEANLFHAVSHTAKQRNVIRVPGVTVQDHIRPILQEHDFVQFHKELLHRQTAVQLHPEMVIDAVAGEQNPVFSEQKQNAAGRVAGQRENLKRPSAQVMMSPGRISRKGGNDA